MSHNPPLWFLTCLFLVKVECYLLTWLIGKRELDFKKGFLAVLVLCSIMGFLARRFLPVRLPWGIDISLTALPFLGAGFLCRGRLTRLLPELRQKAWYGLPVLICLGIVVSKANGMINLSFNNMESLILFQLGAWAGIMASIIISILIPRTEVVEYLEKNTIVILGFHLAAMSFIRGLEAFGITISGSFPENILARSVLYSFLQMLVCMPLIGVLNHWLPALLGRKQEVRVNMSDVR